MEVYRDPKTGRFISKKGSTYNEKQTSSDKIKELEDKIKDLEKKVEQSTKFFDWSPDFTKLIDEKHYPNIEGSVTKSMDALPYPTWLVFGNGISVELSKSSIRDMGFIRYTASRTAEYTPMLVPAGVYIHILLSPFVHECSISRFKCVGYNSCMNADK